MSAFSLLIPPRALTGLSSTAYRTLRYHSREPEGSKESTASVYGFSPANILVVLGSSHPFPLSHNLGTLDGAPAVCLPISTLRYSEFDFAENQLSPSLIGLSPLATSHPNLLQQMRVRSSSKCYLTFNLLMARSLVADPLYKRYAVTQNKSWAPTVCRHSVSGSLSLPLSGCFSPFPHGTGSLSVMHEYLGLESGLPMFRQDFTCPALLKDFYSHYVHWPGPRSLATTYGVSFDVLSSGYLDVSVPRVQIILVLPIAHAPYVLRTGAPLGRPKVADDLAVCMGASFCEGSPSNGYSHLPDAYRSVSRPSSPVHAKASTKCP
eukprot:gene13234-16141_t